jgi:hypothetical protein
LVFIAWRSAVALSDYERRILQEIESELALPGPGRMARCRAGVHRLRLQLAVTAMLLAVAVVVGLFAPAPAALGVDTLAGFVVGWAWAPRRRSRLLH